MQIYTAFHPTNALERFGNPREDGSFAFCKTQTAPVTIGDNVWIGGEIIIMPGIAIGNNVVISVPGGISTDTFLTATGRQRNVFPAYLPLSGVSCFAVDKYFRC